MKLSDALGRMDQLSSSNSKHFYLNGTLEYDSDNAFVRVYSDALNKRSYYRILLSDIEEEVHEWTEGELSQFGFVGQKRHRLTLPHGALVEVVSIALHRIGETVAGDTTASSPLISGQCHYATGCGSHNCCTTGSDGKCYCDDCCVS